MRHNQDTSSYRELYHQPDEGPEKFDTWQTFKLSQFLNKKIIQGQVSRPATQKIRMFTPGNFSMMDEQTANV